MKTSKLAKEVYLTQATRSDLKSLTERQTKAADKNKLYKMFVTEAR
jgi:hypothetical protein